MRAVSFAVGCRSGIGRCVQAPTSSVQAAKQTKVQERRRRRFETEWNEPIIAGILERPPLPGEKGDIRAV
ncbi:hypothetical protein [Gluconobacter japonicus]|uniref:hypothetical protein n=1 Tax=Gluconobacter japonicus TaxID=376620 RepID=UPI002230EB6B|nr:hypothetical protein [Gluconobacter japonicus]